MESSLAAILDNVLTQSPPAATVFVCANCSRPGQAPDSAGRSRPEIPNFRWPFRAEQVTLPCTGRLQPEHILKAFESGTHIVSIIGCREDNCHYLEGSRRCARRVDYLRSLLEEVGIGGERLMFFHLPGTAVEDMTLAAGKAVPASSRNTDEQIAAIRNQVIRALQVMPSNPLHEAPLTRAVMEDSYWEVDPNDDDNDE
jgi:F420-non-reducing hydrogenase iron-sulfur subunit